MSCTAVTDNIKTTLQNNAALTAWIAAIFPGKTLKVIKAYRRKQEINAGDLPIVMITRPTREKAEGTVGRRRYNNKVLLYLGFHFDGDKELAPDILEQFESLVEDALLQDIRRGGAAVDTEWDDSANDEGANHPTYFSVNQFNIVTERSRA